MRCVFVQHRLLQTILPSSPPPSPSLDHFRQIGADRAARVAVPARPPALARGGHVVGEGEQLLVWAVARDQVSDAVSTRASALGALDAQHVELADQVAEDDRAVAGHYSITSSARA